jgi:hypothetical protein
MYCAVADSVDANQLMECSLLPCFCHRLTGKEHCCFTCRHASSSTAHHRRHHVLSAPHGRAVAAAAQQKLRVQAALYWCCLPCCLKQYRALSALGNNGMCYVDPCVVQSSHELGFKVTGVSNNVCPGLSSSALWCCPTLACTCDTLPWWALCCWGTSCQSVSEFTSLDVNHHFHFASPVCCSAATFLWLRMLDPDLL